MQSNIISRAMLIVSVMLALLVSPSVFSQTMDGAPIKVGVIKIGYGAKGIVEALQAESSIQTTVLTNANVSLDELLAYDVVVIGGNRKLGSVFLENLRSYVYCGGGVLAHHLTWSWNIKVSPFPEIVLGVDQKNLLLQPSKKINHPLLKNIPIQFGYGHDDHVIFEKGPVGEVLIVNQDGDPVVIADTLGMGRVVANGMLTGYASGEVEKGPQGGERTLLLNAVRWLGESRMSTITGKELTDRKEMSRKSKEQIERSKILAAEELKNKWFNEDLLRCMSLERPPVTTLGGKYFAIIRQDYLNNFGYFRTRQYMHQLKAIGITDIVQLNIRSAKVYFPSTNPDAVGASNYIGYDPLMMLVRAASEEGIKVWVKLQMAQGGGLLPERMQARYPDGKKITYEGGDPPAGDVPNFLSRDYRNFLHQLIDEFAARYNKYGNFAGIFTDMLWENSEDYHWHELPVFDQFCFHNFGEHLPSDMKTRMAQGKKWMAPEDKWWRRMTLFKQWVNEDFHRDLADYLHEKGFQLGIQVFDMTHLPASYAYGIHPYRWHLIGDYTWDYPGKDYNELNVYSNNLAGTSSHSCAADNTAGFNGQQGGESFNFQTVWRPVVFGTTPRSYEEYKRNILNVREWAGGSSLAKVAFLHNYNGLILQIPDKAGQVRTNALSLFKSLSYCQDMSSIYVEDVSQYGKFRVLIATPYSVSGLSKETMSGLKKYISEGGTVISLNAKWSTSLLDLTDEKDMTREMSGAEYDKDVTEGMTAGEIHVRENVIGKGRVVTIPVADFASTVQKDAVIAGRFQMLVQKYATPEIQIINKKTQNAVKTRIISTLKKNNWIGIALLSDDLKPATTTLSVDVEKLGVTSAGYRVLLLGRKMELLKPGDFDGGASGRGNFWTKDDFKKGFDISILRDNEVDLKVPDGKSIDVTMYYPERKQPVIGTWLNRFWTQYILGRAYEHEIVVIAPADELTIDGKRITE